MIVKRYSDRLQHMLQQATGQREMHSVLATLLDIFIDYDETDTLLAEGVCVYHFLNSTEPRTPADHLIHAAIATVSRKICDTLFSAHELLIDAEEVGIDKSMEAKLLIQTLIPYLGWTTW